MSEAGMAGAAAEPLCLAFVNTVDWRLGDHPEEKLNTYLDLVRWAERAGALPRQAAEALAAEAARRAEEARDVLARATALREAIYRVFAAGLRKKAPAGADLATLNAALTQALAQARIVAVGDGYAWAWGGTPGALDRPLWPVARSAAELLTSPELSRVRQCADDACGWLFFDRSRNRSRRWCDMKDCGNRAKARRHYRRLRALQGSAS